MADAFVDFAQTASTATSPYETWAKAAADIQTGLTQAGAGGRVFVRIDGDDAGGGEKDTAGGGDRTLLFAGTDQVPTVIYGCKNSTTAEPPTDSDLVVRGTDTLPEYEATAGGISLIELNANDGTSKHVHGIRFDTSASFFNGASEHSAFTDCIIEFETDFFGSNLGTAILVNCDINRGSSSGVLRGSGSITQFYGGIFSGNGAGSLIDNTASGLFEFFGVDMSNHTGTLWDLNSNASAMQVRFVNCKMATGVTRITGSADAHGPFIEMIGSTDETGLGSGESVEDYAREYGNGTVLSEETIVRTGGANDGVKTFSYVIQPNSASTKESLQSIVTPWFGGLVEGDGSTSKDFTVFIANDSGSDKTKADAWLELFIPSQLGVTQHDYFTTRVAIDASPGDIDDDTVSDWSTGAGGKNAQKFVIAAKIPDYTGPVYGRVHYAEEGTGKLYVDPKVYVTDT